MVLVKEVRGERLKKWCWLRKSEEREIEEVVLVKEVRGERD